MENKLFLNWTDLNWKTQTKKSPNIENTNKQREKKLTYKQTNKQTNGEKNDIQIVTNKQTKGEKLTYK